MASSLLSLRATTRRLLLSRFLRSLGQGALVVDFALYLHALGWEGFAIGVLLTGAGLFGVALNLPLALAGDRWRRKPLLLAYEGLVLATGIAALLTSRTGPLVAAAVAGGFGRGANGAAGPFSPSEQAWLAEEVRPERRGFVYSLNTALGFFGMALGAAAATLPPAFARWLPGALAFRPLFGLVAICAAANLLVLAGAEERHRGARGAAAAGGTDGGARAELARRENRLLAKLVLVNSVNGLAIGLTGPLISYWFALRFRVGPASIAPVLAATFALTGIAALATGRLTERIGVVRSVVGARLVGLVLLLLLPVVPGYGLASAVYLLRSAFNRGSAGARQALAIGLVGEERRGLASSLNTVAFQLPQSVGPSVAGYLLGAGFLTLPFYAAALLQAIYLVAYARAFRDVEVGGARPRGASRRPGRE